LEEVLNEMTIAAIEEGKCILQDVYSPRYSSMESLVEALDYDERY